MSPKGVGYKVKATPSVKIKPKTRVRPKKRK